MIIKFLCTTFFTALTSLQAKEVVSLGDYQNYNQFKAYLNSNSNLVSHTKSKINFNKLKNYKLIKSKYDLGFKGLLNEDLTISNLLFKEIISFQKKGVIDLKAKDLISKSYLHLASLEKERMQDWVKKAASFNPHYIIDSELFNPTITTAFNMAAKLIKPKLISKNYLQSYFKSEKKIFINGFLNNAVIEKNKNYYVTIYQEGLRPKSFIKNSNQFNELNNMKLDPFSLGNCSSPNFSKDIDHIFYSSSCIKKQSDEKMLSWQNQENFISHNDLNHKEINLNVKAPKKRFFKRKSTWLVIGTSLLATSAVILFNDQNKSKKFEPVHRVSSK